MSQRVYLPISDRTAIFITKRSLTKKYRQEEESDRTTHCQAFELPRRTVVSWRPKYTIDEKKKTWRPLKSLSLPGTIFWSSCNTSPPYEPAPPHRLLPLDYEPTFEATTFGSHPATTLCSRSGRCLRSNFQFEFSVNDCVGRVT